MKVFIGADHEGFEYKQQLSQALTLAGHQPIDVGNHAIDPNDDYPQFAKELVTQLLNYKDGEAKGILISGNGQNMAIAANRFKAIRASVCYNRSTAESARADDNCNVLCLSSRFLSLDEAGTIMATWLATNFGEDEAMQRRLKQLDELN